MWQGDTRFWGRRSPVLFPIVGRVWEDTYRYAGNSYRMGQHGIARDMDIKIKNDVFKVTVMLQQKEIK